MRIPRALRARFTLNRLLVAIVLVAVFLGVVSLVKGGGSSPRMRSSTRT